MTDLARKLLPILLVVAATITIVVLARERVLILPGMSRFTTNAVVADDGIDYGPVFSEPGKYQRHLLRDPWMQRVRVGKSTFGKLLLEQSRFDIEGSGAMTGRRIYAATPPAARLLDGPMRNRTLAILHGIQRTLDERNGYVYGVSFSDSGDGFAANRIADYIEATSLTAETPEERREVQQVFQYEKQYDRGVGAVTSAEWIVLAPMVSKPLNRTLRNPRRVNVTTQFFVAMVIRHEIEHTVSAVDWRFDDFETVMQLRWMEEGTADVIARWPGQAAKTAKLLGLRYPKGAETRAYDDLVSKRSGHLSGYSPWVSTLRILLTAGGIDVHSAKQFAAADRILQNGPVEKLPDRLARAIVREHHLPGRRTATIARRIRATNGEPKRAKRLVASLKNG